MTPSSTPTKDDRCRLRCVSMHPTFLEELQASHAVLDGGVSPVEDEEESQLVAHHHEEEEATSTTITSAIESSPTISTAKRIPSSKMLERRVSFTSLEIREYPVVPGDHPQCSSGCPVSLDWNYQHASEHSVDQYEALRSTRRPRDQLRLSVQERESLLSANDCTLGEVRRAARKHHRSKSCEGHYYNKNNRKTMQESFFQAA